jgi:NitT/TauT family transport system substrate-binding protein
MNRRRFLGSTVSLGASLIARPYLARAATKQILVAEPVHSTGYLPLYIAMAKGFFDEADVSVSIVTIENGGGHTNAVLSGQAFAFIGGPEHNAFAKAKGAELRAVVHCVDRGNVYYCAAKGAEPAPSLPSPASGGGKGWGDYFRGKTIAVGPFGGTPNSITRYFLKQWNLDPKRDVTLIETANSATIAVVKGRQAQIGEATEPYVTQGVRQSIWGEPFLSVPKELGPYAFSTFNVRLDTIQKDPELVRAFVRGMVNGLKFLYANRDESAAIAKKQFPTMPLDDLKATLSRSFADQMWSPDGVISRQAWATASAVVRSADILKTDIGYDEIIDMHFVESIRATL